MIDPDTASKLLKFQTDYATYDGTQRKAISDKAETWAVLGHQLSQMPYAQRAAFIDQNRDLLHSHQISDAEINAFDPTDSAIQTEMNLALGAKGIMAQQNSDRQYGEEVRSHRASEASAAQGHAIAIRGQNMTDARARASLAGSGGNLDPASLDYAAQMYRMTGQIPAVGFGASGSAARTAIVTRAAQLASANGQTAADDVAAHARYAGNLAGERAVGTRSANIEMASAEAANVIPLARAASASVSRSGFVPLARVQQMIASGNNDPNLRAFVAANNAVINTYSRAISPTGVPNVTATEHARQMLSTTFDQQSYNRVLDMFGREIAAARKAPAQVRSSLDTAITGRAPPPMQTARNPRTGQRLGFINGQWAPIQ